jgi:hypothetical protein
MSLTDINVAVLSDEVRPHALVQVLLIPLQRPEVVIATLNDETTSFFEC